LVAAFVSATESNQKGQFYRDLNFGIPAKTFFRQERGEKNEKLTKFTPLHEPCTRNPNVLGVFRGPMNLLQESKF
jgi:hypothetical protein